MYIILTAHLDSDEPSPISRAHSHRCLVAAVLDSADLSSEPKAELVEAWGFPGAGSLQGLEV